MTIKKSDDGLFSSDNGHQQQRRQRVLHNDECIVPSFDEKQESKRHRRSPFIDWMINLFEVEEEEEEKESKDYFERATCSLDCALNDLNIEIQNQRKIISKNQPFINNNNNK